MSFASRHGWTAPEEPTQTPLQTQPGPPLPPIIGWLRDDRAILQRQAQQMRARQLEAQYAADQRRWAVQEKERVQSDYFAALWSRK